jgi:ABC-type dipeptide/oligopeptide/nickel transport system permease subunit
MCFSLEFLKLVLIWAVVIVAILSILGLLVPFIVKRLGIALGEGWAVCVQAFRIFCWAIVAIVVILFCFELIACLLSFTGGSLLPRH